MEIIRRVAKMSCQYAQPAWLRANDGQERGRGAEEVVFLRYESKRGGAELAEESGEGRGAWLRGGGVVAAGL